MAGKKDPAFALYAADWLHDIAIREIPRELRASLVGLWSIAWLHGGVTEASVPGICGLVDANEIEVRRLLERFFVRSGDTWVSPRMEAEREERKAVREKRQKNGQKGAGGRWPKQQAG